MPLYEYECTECKRHTEKIQKFSDAEITICPHCGGLLERVITAPAIAFKGGGWFKDGYGNARPAASSEGKSDSGEAKASSDAKSSDSKSTSSDAPAAASPASAPAAASATPSSPASSSDK